MDSQYPTKPNEPETNQKSLCMTWREACAALGGISRTTLWRLERRGLIRRVEGLGKAIFTSRSVIALAEGRMEKGGAA